MILKLNKVETKNFYDRNRTPKYICRGQGTKNFFTNSCTHFFQGRNYNILKKEINFWPILQKNVFFFDTIMAIFKNIFIENKITDNVYYLNFNFLLLQLENCQVKYLVYQNSNIFLFICHK